MSYNPLGNIYNNGGYEGDRRIEDWGARTYVGPNDYFDRWGGYDYLGRDKIEDYGGYTYIGPDKLDSYGGYWYRGDTKIWPK